MQIIHRSRGSIVRATVFLALACAVVPAAGSQAAAGKGPVVSTATTSLGRVLVDAHGHTPVSYTHLTLPTTERV